MCSKAVCVLIGAMILIQTVSSDRQLCPDPKTANQLIYKEEVHEEAPSFGRTEKLVSIPITGKSPSCISLVGIASAGPSGSVSMVAVGISKDAVVVKLVSDIKQGIDGEIEVYTE